ncbi:MAG TPA: alpha/beta hydrolase [Bryobacteraceae bacterium]|nr:alpha/beta hydrolase [Bryobacteraceae bacterium]
MGLFTDMSDLTSSVRFSRIATNGIHLHVAEAGPPDGPLVILLHGFPEFWYGWRKQIAPLAAQGFHVIAPDQRGYNLSDKPEGIASYDLDLLAADVIGLADHFERQTFALVGHDWGSAVGWWTAGLYPGRVQRLAILNAPHPAVWLEAVRNNPVQRRKSSYVRLFGIPWLPEFLIRLSRFQALATAFRDSVRPGAFTDADLKAYSAAWSQPGAITAMIHYYRAALRRQFAPAAEYRISSPVLIIWGPLDVYVIPQLAEASKNLCDDGRIVWLDNATHWVQHDQPERVAELLTDFLR